MMKRKIVLFGMLMLLHVTQMMFGQSKGFYENVQKKNINKVLDDLNAFAAAADFKNYFDLYAEESTFIGTDATEVWSKKDFMAYAKPYFDKGKAWNFTSLQRNIYFSPDGKFAWFDEILDTQMKLCRGSGVLERTGNGWKIKQYVLSMTVPNEVVDEAVKVKAPIESVLLQKLKAEK